MKAGRVLPERTACAGRWTERSPWGAAVDPLFERFLAKAEEYARLAEQAHDPTVAHEYQDLARQWRELAIRLEEQNVNPTI